MKSLFQILANFSVQLKHILPVIFAACIIQPVGAQSSFIQKPKDHDVLISQFMSDTRQSYSHTKKNVFFHKNRYCCPVSADSNFTVNVNDAAAEKELLKKHHHFIVIEIVGIKEVKELVEVEYNALHFQDSSPMLSLPLTSEYEFDRAAGKYVFKRFKPLQ